MDFQKLLNRVKNILVSPKTEWPVIAAEPATVGSLYTGYAMILALIPAICGVIGTSIMVPGAGVAFAVVTAVLGYVLGLAVLYVMALIIDAIAPSFGGEKNFVNSLKLVIYSSTPTWVAGFLSLIPVLGLLALLALVYGIYLMYLGVTPVKRTPPDRAGGFTAVIVVAWIVLTFVVGAVVGLIVAATLGTAALTAGALG